MSNKIPKALRWPDGCPLTLNEIPSGGDANYKGHIDCLRKGAALFASQLVNSDPFPGVYSDGVRCRVHHISGYGPRRDEKPKFDPRPEFSNHPNPILVMFRRIDEARSLSTRAETAALVLEDLDGYQIGYDGADEMDDAYDGATEEHCDHARKVLSRIVSMS